MGRKSREKIRGEGYIEKAKEWILDVDDRKSDYQSVKVRQHYWPRWAEECGIDPKTHSLAEPEVIEALMKNPQVSLEWKLCDPRVQKAIRDPDKRAIFLDTLSDEERDIYLNMKDEKGHTYTELEKPKGKMVYQSAKKALRIKG